MLMFYFCCWSPVPPVTLNNAQIPLDMFPRGSCQLVADLLATRQTTLTCQDVTNKSATSWQEVVVMEFGKRHDTTETTDFCPRQLVTDLLWICQAETGVVDFGKTCYGEVAKLLWTCYGAVTNLLRTC